MEDPVTGEIDRLAYIDWLESKISVLIRDQLLESNVPENMDAILAQENNYSLFQRQ